MGVVEKHRARRSGVGVVAALAAAALVVTLAPSAHAATADPPWMNTALSPDQRAVLLLQAMTLEEKVELMSGDQGAAPAAFYNAPIERLGIPELSMADATAGIASRGWVLPETGDRATAMPATLALAATWDPERVRDYAGVVGDESRQTGHEVLLGPNADPTRNPFWGRQAESTGEDPELSSSIVVPFVQEVQERGVIANLKHYTAYTQETYRGGLQNVIVDERTLREVHTAPYEAAIRDADLGSVMCSFNKINGVYACESELALNEILREQLDFTGFVLTDFGAIHSTLPSIVAGTDMETGTRSFYGDTLLAAVNAGTVPEVLVDRAVLRILRTMFAIGIFDGDYTPTAIPVEEHGAVAREVQEDAITLLKNDDALPLDAGTSVAVVGADATIPSALGGSAFVQPTYEVSLLDAMRDRAEESGAQVRYAQGNDPVSAANMIETRDMTAVPSSVLRPERGIGDGLTARYFANATWTGAVGLTRTEAQASYDVGFTGGGPAFASLYGSQVPPTPTLAGLEPAQNGEQSVRWTGELVAPSTGEYVLGATGWGDARVWLDGDLVVDMTGQDGRRDVRSAGLALEAGRAYDLRVEYSQTRPLVGLQPGTFLLQWSTPDDALPPSVVEAAEAAAASDVAVVYVRTYETEERDMVSLKLPQNAEQLIRQVAAANPRTVVVVATGSGVVMPWADAVPAVLQNFYGGQEEGNALASVLFGDEDPSGHLPVSYPRSEEALPLAVQNPWLDDPDVEFSEGLNIGYRGYLAANVEPMWAFGHGLSYTEFTLDRLRAGNTIRATGGNDTVDVRARLRNVGDRTGTEVVQVYLGPLPGVPSPELKLAGYAKVELEAGRRQQVRIELDRRDFSYWDAEADEWVTPTGQVAVYVGRSAVDVDLAGAVRVRR
ncbi:glycoside hydrolase family 3 C-terminal domain-containing protein [Cellulosimicrobium sp. Marseille-Q8652]